MGRSDPHIMPWYRHHINPEGKVALLGFRNNNVFKGDLYDQHLENWDINSEWELTQKYDTIICTRCAYFAKDESFMLILDWEIIGDLKIIKLGGQKTENMSTPIMIKISCGRQCGMTVL